MKGIVVPKTIGIGDAIEFTSVPENYFRTFNEKLIDVEGHWVFDHNPYIVRTGTPDQVVPLWTKCLHHKIEGTPCYSSLAHKCATMIGAKVFLRHPRLYAFEGFPFHSRRMILLQVDGISHGRLPDHIIKHVLAKYASPWLFQIGLKDEKLGIPWLKTPTLWELADVIGQSRMVIGPDSGPIWIAACYPDVIAKKVRMKPSAEVLEKWIPLAVDNVHAQWDDLQLMKCYNPTEDDVGFTSSFRRI